VHRHTRSFIAPHRAIIFVSRIIILLALTASEEALPQSRANWVTFVFGAHTSSPPILRQQGANCADKEHFGSYRGSRRTFRGKKHVGELLEKTIHVGAVYCLKTFMSAQVSSVAGDSLWALHVSQRVLKEMRTRTRGDTFCTHSHTHRNHTRAPTF